MRDFSGEVELVSMGEAVMKVWRAASRRGRMSVRRSAAQDTGKKRA